MNGHRWMTVLAAALVVTGLGLAAEAQEEGVRTTVVGTVVASWDEDWNLTGVTVRDDAKDPPVSLPVVMDAKGKALAEEMEGRKVEVTGTMVKQNNANALKVTAYKAVQSAAEAPPAAEEGGE